MYVWFTILTFICLTCENCVGWGKCNPENVGDSFYHQVNVGNLVVLKGFELGFFSVRLNIYYVFIENIMGLNEPLTQDIHFALVAESVWKLPVLDYNLLGDGN